MTDRSPPYFGLDPAADDAEPVTVGIDKGSDDRSAVSVFECAPRPWPEGDLANVVWLKPDDPRLESAAQDAASRLALILSAQNPEADRAQLLARAVLLLAQHS